MATKILLVHNGSDLYGASRFLLWLVSRLDRNKFEPIVVLPCQGPLADALCDHHIEIAFFSSLTVISRQTLNSWRVLPFLVRIPVSVLALWIFIRKMKIGLVHTNTGTILSAGLAAKLAGVPHIWHVHDSFHEYPVLWAFYSRYILWSSDKVICVSQSVARQFPDHSRKVVVIYNGLPDEEFGDVAPDQLEAFRNRYGLNNKKTVGVIGRIKFQRKGQDVFVKAIALLKGKLRDVKYLIVGSPFPGNESHLQALKKLIKELDIEDVVILTGDVEDMKSVYGSLDLLVVPSCFPEPFGLVILEAMAMGVPVIATNIGGPPELIQDGSSGILVEPNDPEMLAEKIELLFNDRSLYASIQKEARKRFEEKFQFRSMLTRIEELYTEVLSPKEEENIQK